MKPQKLLYLHGFNSSPQSLKAQLMQSYMQDHLCADALICPQIPEYPDQAKHFLEDLVEKTLLTNQLSFIGSSLGGYYATYLADKYSGVAALINPSVKPFETLMQYLGENIFYYEDRSWHFDESHIKQLKQLEVPTIKNPQDFLVLLQTGDETLDYREAVRKYGASHCVVEQGGNHAFNDFQRHIPGLLKFCNIECD